MSSARVHPKHRPNRDSKGASVYPTSLEGRTGVVEERKAKNYRHVTRKRSPSSPRVVPYENRPNRQSEGTGIYNNVSLTDRTGARVDLNPEEVYYRSRLKEVKNKVLNDPEKKNKPIGNVFGDVGLSNYIHSNLRRGGKYSKNKRSQKTKSRNFRKTRHRSRV
jgi:hypothetical protein